MRWKRGVDGAGQSECIDPRAEAVKGKHAQESFLCCSSMGNDPTGTKRGFDLRPEIHKKRSSDKKFISYSVDLPCRPSDLSGRAEIGIQGCVDLFATPMDDCDLNRLVSEAWSRSGTFKIYRRKRNFGDFQSRRSFSVISQSMQASVMETPYWRLVGWGGSD